MKPIDRARLATLAGTLTLTIAAHAEDIVVGAPLALTGPYAWVGVPSREGIEVALEEVNRTQALGANQLKLVIEDTGSDKGQAITLVNRFALRDKALLVLGPSSSVEGIAVAPVANELKVPMLSATAVSDAIGKAGPWSFKLPASPARIVDDVCRYAVAHGIRSVALVTARDNDGAVAQKDAAGRCFKAAQVAVVFDESVLATDSDFLAIQSKLIAAKPQGVFMGLGGEQAANFVVQARQNGVDPKVQFMGGPAMGAAQFLTIGGSAIEGTIYPADYYVGGTSAENKAFIAAFQKKYGRQPDFGAALGYASVKVAVAAIKAAGPHPTREAVRDALKTTAQMPTVLGTGRVGFDANRGGTYNGIVVRVKDGKLSAAE